MKTLYFAVLAVFLSGFCLSCEPEAAKDDKLPQYSENEDSGGYPTDYNFPAYSKGDIAEDIERQILQAYLEKLKSASSESSGGENADLTIDDVWIEKYYGTYCPTYIFQELYAEGKTYDEIYYAPENQTVFAVMMGSKGQDNGTEQQYVSLRHQYARTFVKDGNRIFLWHEGQLYNLADHYNYHLLTNEDFLEIANLQNGLDLETHSRIQEDFGDSIRWIQGYRDEIAIYYLGTYNGYMALISYANSDLTAIGHLEVGGVHFNYFSMGNRIFAWKEGQIYTLPDLYEQKLITRNQLVKMVFNLDAKEEE